MIAPIGDLERMLRIGREGLLAVLGVRDRVLNL